MKLGGGLSEVSGGVKGLRRSMDLIIAHCIHIWHSRRIQILNKWVNKISFGFSQEVNSSFKLSFRLQKTFEFNKKLLTFTIWILETWATHARPCAPFPLLSLFSSPGPAQRDIHPPDSECFAEIAQHWNVKITEATPPQIIYVKDRDEASPLPRLPETFRSVMRVHIYQIRSRGEGELAFPLLHGRAPSFSPDVTFTPDNWPS